MCIYTKSQALVYGEGGGNNHLYLVPRYINHPKGNTMMIKQSLFILPFPQFLETTSVLSMSMYLLIKDIYNNRVIC